MDKKYMEEFGKRIRARREELGMSQLDRLFDTDLVKDFQDHSPLEALQPTRIVLRKKAKK